MSAPDAVTTDPSEPISGDVRGVARRIVALADPHEKCARSRAAAAAWRDGALDFGADEPAGLPPAPVHPGRPDAPELLAPNAMPKRKLTGVKGRATLLHALAHIELNAVNLAWDMVGRFASAMGARAFVDDWVSVADDEARHFTMLAGRLAELDSHYGACPAHDGLWEAAANTRDDVLSRLAVVPMVLEARGLDVCPDMIDRLESVADQESAAILRIIYEDEIGHVRIGLRWFEALCGERNLPLKETWQDLVRRHFKGPLKPPFNDDARARAGFPRTFYEPLGSR